MPTGGRPMGMRWRSILGALCWLDLGEEAPVIRVLDLDLGAVAWARAQIPAWGIAPPERLVPVRMGFGLQD